MKLAKGKTVYMGGRRYQGEIPSAAIPEKMDKSRLEAQPEVKPAAKSKAKSK